MAISTTPKPVSYTHLSVNYMFDKLACMGLPISTIAGVPAFIAAGAISGLHIVKQEEELVVLPGIVTAEELATLLTDGHVVVVIMKLSQCTEDVYKRQTGHTRHPS